MLNTTTIAFKSKITKAFKILRLMDYWCKQNHTCCNSCGWADIPNDKRDKVVFYHLQDNESLKDNEPILYLSWSGNHDEIIKVLSFVGIEATCGNPESERIECLKGNPIPAGPQVIL